MKNFSKKITITGDADTLKKTRAGFHKKTQKHATNKQDRQKIKQNTKKMLEESQ